MGGSLFALLLYKELRVRFGGEVRGGAKQKVALPGYQKVSGRVRVPLTVEVGDKAGQEAFSTQC